MALRCPVLVPDTASVKGFCTRMHSNRVRTARSSSRHGGGVWAWTRSPSTSPLGVGLDQIPLNFPLGCGPGPDPPQLPPWVWAWTRPPSTSPLGVGLDQIPLNFPLGCEPRPDPPQLPPWLWAWRPYGQIPLTSLPPKNPAPPPPRTRHPPLEPGTPPVNRITDTCKNITLPQTSFAGGNNISPSVGHCLGPGNNQCDHTIIQ